MRLSQSTFLVLSILLSVSRSFAGFFGSHDVLKQWNFPSCDRSWKVCLQVGNTADITDYFPVRIIETEDASKFVWLRESSFGDSLESHDITVRPNGEVYAVTQRLPGKYRDQVIYVRIGHADIAAIKAAGPTLTGTAVEFVPDPGFDITIQKQHFRASNQCQALDNKPGQYQRNIVDSYEKVAVVTKNGAALLQAINMGPDAGHSDTDAMEISSVPCIDKYK